MDGKIIDGIRRHREVCVGNVEANLVYHDMDVGKRDDLFRRAKSAYNPANPTQRAMIGALYQKEFGISRTEAVAYSESKLRIHDSAFRWFNFPSFRLAPEPTHSDVLRLLPERRIQI